jgi:hypothetical protein
MDVQLQYVIPLMVHHNEYKLVLIHRVADIRASNECDQCGDVEYFPLDFHSCIAASCCVFAHLSSHAKYTCTVQ